MVVTMATVGFGDFAPRTIPGRMLGFFICIYGVVGVSLMVLTLQNILTLSFRENRVFFSYNLQNNKNNNQKGNATI